MQMKCQRVQLHESDMLQPDFSMPPFVSLREPSLLTHGLSFILRHALSATLGVILSQPSQSLSVTLGHPWSPGTSDEDAATGGSAPTGFFVNPIVTRAQTTTLNVRRN